VLPRIGPTHGVQATAKDAPKRRGESCSGFGVSGFTGYSRSRMGTRSRPVRCSPSMMTIVPARRES
jgi:hypothetical protein